jgi:hypothetical protein
VVGAGEEGSEVVNHSIDYLRTLLRYDEEAGKFYWTERAYGAPSKPGRRRVGVAGYTRKDGYVQITVKPKIYQASRLAWAFVYGAWPEHEIDHINRIRNDNRICNLREVEPYQNKQNKVLRSNKTGLPGVSLHKKNGKFHARIRLRCKTISLGYYRTPEEASEAYLEARKEMHPFAPETQP